MTDKHDKIGVDAGAIGRLCLRLMGFSILWAVLTRGAVVDGWYFGVAAVVLATWASYWVKPSGGGMVRPLGLLRFIPFFVRRSVQGAFDVALRAFKPSRPLSPALVDYELRIRPGSTATLAFVGSISLLPGTLCCGLGPSSVTVHVVDDRWPIVEQLEELEARVAAVFGEPLEAEGAGR